ncbi:MAG: hypothetical protein OEV01_09355 [Nitrospira sp.]|nr:hypothetical protein [Nitrospira sp.]MDH4305545.1 hypothetical protein [Nitrospira sp.]MDH5195122.1 hypothetical protein [Nitrospira sp.]
MSSTCFAVVVADGLDVDVQQFHAVRGWRDRMGQRRDGGAHAFALDMDEQCPVVLIPMSVIVFAVPHWETARHSHKPPWLIRPRSRLVPVLERAVNP